MNISNNNNSTQHNNNFLMCTSLKIKDTEIFTSLVSHVAALSLRAKLSVRAWFLVLKLQ